tara:strand:+ start:1015 stop:1125 length:111 start_codon:yes stop_codon:yes gene_type:complete
MESKTIKFESSKTYTEKKDITRAYIIKGKIFDIEES